MTSSTSVRRGGFAAVGLATLALAGCGMNATHSAAAAPAPASTTTATAPSTTASTPSQAPAAAAIGERATSLGEVLVDARGRTLYTYALDGNGMSACSGACAAAWPPDLVSPGQSLTGDLRLPGHAGMTMRADGHEQATYDGHPLYTFKGDTAAGQTKGAGLKGVWFAVAPDGTRVPARAPRVQPNPAPVPATPRAPAPPTTPQPPAPTPRPSAPPTMHPAPQGGGDGDADNFGGPNDGDGNK